MKIVFLPVLSLLLLTACNVIKPAIPNLPASQINSIPLQDSRIDVPVTINLEQVINNLSTKFPLELSGEGSAGPGQYRWQLQRRPFGLTMQGNSMSITDTARFSGGGYLKNPFTGKWKQVCSCDADAAFGINASFNIETDYSLRGDASLTQLDMTVCNLKVIDFNLTPIIKPHVAEAINNALAGVNQQVKQYNFRTLLQPAWAALYQPIKIADIGWIVLNPSAIRVGAPVGSGHTLKLSAGITAKPVFYLENPGRTPVIALPDISNGTGGDGFNLNLDIKLAYKPLNDILKNAVSGKKITDGTNGYLIIKDAAIFGTGNDHLLLKIKFSGKHSVFPYHGILYFTCLPQYDVNTGNFYINDIDFDVSTIKTLQEGPAVWILGSVLKKYMNSQVYFNISGQVNAVKNKLNQAINSRITPNVILSGNVDSLRLEGILPVSDYILLRVSTIGKLEAEIK